MSKYMLNTDNSLFDIATTAQVCVYKI